MSEPTRTVLRKAIERALRVNPTMADSRIFHERRVGFSVEELPAVNILMAEQETQFSEDRRWEMYRFTVAALLVQDQYNPEDGGFEFVAKLDEFEAQVRKALGCLKVSGCRMNFVDKTTQNYDAEGQSMFASAWVSVMFQTEAPMFG